MGRGHFTPDRNGVFLGGSRGATCCVMPTNYQCMGSLEGSTESESGSVREYMCDDHSYDAQVCISTLALQTTMDR